MADLVLIPQMFSAKRFGVEFSQFPLCSEVFDNCMKIDEFEKASPKNQPDFE